MILLDANVLLIDTKYTRDSNYGTNRRALERIETDRLPVGMLVQGLLEVVGALSFQTPLADIPTLPDVLQTQYKLTVVPNPVTIPEYAACTYSDVLHHIGAKMSLGDAVMASQIRLYSPSGSILLSWDEPHFRGKLNIPVLTPADWLAANDPVLTHPGASGT